MKKVKVQDFNLFGDVDFDLDEELNLFSDDDWDYSDGIQDLRVKIKNTTPTGTYVLFILIGIIFIVGGLFYLKINDNSKEYENYIAQIDSAQINYVSGEECSSDMYIDVSTFFQNYANAIKSSKDFSELDAYMVAESLLKKKYQKYASGAKASYDEYDSNAKALKQFACCLQFGTVDKVILKDDIYYVYINTVEPTKESIREYLNQHKYNLAKHFNGVFVTENDLSRFLLETMAQNKMICGSVTNCYELQATEEGLKLVTDADILSVCTDGYNYAINQLTGMIGDTTSMR